MGRGRGRGVRLQPVNDKVEEPTIAKVKFIGIDYPIHGTKRLVKYRDIRILYIVHTLFRGGAEMSTLELCRGLSANGCEIFFVNMPYSDKPEHDCMLEPDIMDVVKDYQYIYEATVPGRTKWIQSHVERVNPDVIIYSLLDITKILVPVPGHPPLLVHTHSNLPDSLFTCKSPAIDGIITVSRDMAKQRLEMGCNPKTLYTVYNGVNPDRVVGKPNLRETLNISKDVKIFGMVGNLNALKRPLVGLDAFNAIDPKKRRCAMIFAGNPKDQGGVLGDKVKEYGLEDYVHILGLYEDIGSVYSTLDVHLNCSTSEGLPMSIIEAMLNGLPIIATSVGGNPELVKHGVNGFLFDVDDVEKLASHMIYMTDNPDIAKRMGKESYRRAERLFTSNVMTRNFKNIIEKFILRPKDILCSVVLPVYNGQETITEAIESILTQTCGAFEFIIVDDGSSDRTTDIISKYVKRDDRIKLIRQPHLNIVEALNTGIRHAKTDWIVRMDADDISLPERIEKQLSYSKLHPDVDVIGTQIIRFFSDGTGGLDYHKNPITHEEIRQAMVTRNPMSHPTVMFRKSAFDKVGGYKGDGRCEDYRLWIELMGDGCKFYNIPEHLLLYRRSHETNVQYHAWRDSILAELHELAQQLLVDKC